MNALTGLYVPMDLRCPAPQPASLGAIPRAVRVPQRAGTSWRKLAAVSGPGYLVAVGYMDLGRGATDIAGGSACGPTLPGAVLAASALAINGLLLWSPM